MNNAKMSRREFAAATLGAAAVTHATRALADTPDPRKTRSYNENMEYRRLGRTDIMISAISMGGHWKKIPYKVGSEDFAKNRREVIYAALDHGINYVDACVSTEVETYVKAVKDRRKEIYMGFDWSGARKPELAGSLDRLKQEIDLGLKTTGLDYVDVLRLTMREQATHNAPQEIDNVVAALDWAKKDRTGASDWNLHTSSAVDRGSSGQVPAIRSRDHAVQRGVQGQTRGQHVRLFQEEPCRFRRH